MTSRRTVGAALVVLAALAGATACSSGSGSDSPSAAAPNSAAASAPAVEGELGTSEMRALCAQMVADQMSVDAATALAEGGGFVARVGTIDGQPQAVTMDLREDRFTFDVEADVVVACTYG